jgi:hypothetical protein
VNEGPALQSKTNANWFKLEKHAEHQQYERKLLCQQTHLVSQSFMLDSTKR